MLLEDAHVCPAHLGLPVCTFVRNDWVGERFREEVNPLDSRCFPLLQGEHRLNLFIGPVYLPLLSPTSQTSLWHRRKMLYLYGKHSCLGISPGTAIPKGSQNTPPSRLPALSPACLGSPDRLVRQTCYSPCPSPGGWDSFGFVLSLEEIRDSCLTASFPSQDLLADPSNPAQLGFVRGVGAVWQTERHLSGRPRGTLPKN